MTVFFLWTLLSQKQSSGFLLSDVDDMICLTLLIKKWGKCSAFEKKVERRRQSKDLLLLRVVEI